MVLCVLVGVRVLVGLRVLRRRIIGIIFMWARIKIWWGRGITVMVGICWARFITDMC